VTAVAAVIILVAMAGGYVFRGLLLKTLRNKHAHVFAELGRPSNRELASILPRHGDVQIRFWKYLWGQRILLIDDKLVSRLAVAARVADVGLMAGMVLLLWCAAK
jgi:hypothetical protein